MLTGKVKWFDARKGYGFLTGPDGQDVFVHYSKIEGEGFRYLRDGESVEYEPGQRDKGLHALKVRRVAVPAAKASGPGSYEQQCSGRAC